MNLRSVKEGDMVEVDKKGRRFSASVVEKQNGTLHVRPVDSKITYRTATAREVVGHWRRVG